MNLKLENKEEIKQEVNEFFQSDKWKNFLTFLIFVAIAFGFWLIQYYQRKFEAEVVIPLSYANIPAEIVIKNDLPEKIDLKISDKGTAIFHYFFRKKELGIAINLAKIPTEKTSYTIDHSTLYNYIQNQLLSTSELKSFVPEMIEVLYSPLANKQLPVILKSGLKYAPGYTLSDSIRIEPAFVTAYGDEEQLKNLTGIETEWVERKNINKKIDIAVDLHIPEKVRLSQEQVQISANVSEFTEKTISIPIVCSGLPEDRIVRFFPSNAEIHIQIGLDKYMQINESDFEISINFQDLIKITNDKTYAYPLSLTRKPDGIINYRIVPETVQFLIEQNER